MPPKADIWTNFANLSTTHYKTTNCYNPLSGTIRWYVNTHQAATKMAECQLGSFSKRCTTAPFISSVENYVCKGKLPRLLREKSFAPTASAYRPKTRAVASRTGVSTAPKSSEEK
jgi:hypothetical protein